MSAYDFTMKSEFTHTHFTEGEIHFLEQLQYSQILLKEMENIK